MKINKELHDLIVEQDLSVNQLAEDFCNIIIQDFGTHNYKRVREVVNVKLRDVERQEEKEITIENIKYWANHGK